MAVYFCPPREKVDPNDFCWEHEPGASRRAGRVKWFWPQALIYMPQASRPQLGRLKRRNPPDVPRGLGAWRLTRSGLSCHAPKRPNQIPVSIGHLVTLHLTFPSFFVSLAFSIRRCYPQAVGAKAIGRSVLSRLVSNERYSLSSCHV